MGQWDMTSYDGMSFRFHTQVYRPYILPNLTGIPTHLNIYTYDPFVPTPYPLPRLTPTYPFLMRTEEIGQLILLLKWQGNLFFIGGRDKLPELQNYQSIPKKKHVH